MEICENLLEMCFLLDSTCYLVRGYKRGAIYNLSTDHVLSVDEKLTEILEKCEASFSLARILDDTEGLQASQLVECLKTLEAANIGSFYRQPAPFIEKIQPVLIPEQISALFIAIPPSYAFLEITPQCNINCFFCDPQDSTIRRKTGCTRTSSPEAVSLGIDEWLQVVDDLAWIRCSSLHVIGGEPWLSPTVLTQVLARAHEKGIPYLFITTNALLLDDQRIQFLAEHHIQVLIQVFSHRPDVHDRIVGASGSYDLLQRNLRKLRSAGVAYSFSLLLLEDTVDEYHLTLAALEEAHPQRVNVDVLRPKSFANAVKSKLFPYLFRSQAQFPSITKDNFFHCRYQHPCWFGKLAITASGNVLPCIVARRECLGNVRSSRLADLYKDGAFDPYWYLTMDQFEECSGCEYRYACFDCRPLVQSICNRHAAKDPYCTYDPQHGEWHSPGAALQMPAR